MEIGILEKEVVKMNRNAVAMINAVYNSGDFFACGIIMPKITYHGLGFDK